MGYSSRCKAKYPCRLSWNSESFQGPEEYDLLRCCVIVGLIVTYSSSYYYYCHYYYHRRHHHHRRRRRRRRHSSPSFECAFVFHALSC
jgi:hypothetical protein